MLINQLEKNIVTLEDDEIDLTKNFKTIRKHIEKSNFCLQLKTILTMITTIEIIKL